ncbi:MAG TPA: hypothetical protein VFN36_03010 [Solirubrobacteraceae bacterium]|nr:hypothetical protein [Solirubrobacteraceae bacterium]
MGRKLADRLTCLVMAPLVLAALVPAQASAASGPTDTSPPTVSTASGQPPAVGDTLTVSAGTWSGSPTPQVYAYTWWDCAPGGGSGTDCTQIAAAGSDSTTYTLTAADVGQQVQVDVYVDDGEHASAWSNLTATVAATPTLLGAPQVLGAARAGAILRAAPGTWTGTPTAYRYSWWTCPPHRACTLIPGAASNRLSVRGAEAGDRIVVQVVAYDDAGASRPVRSAATAPVTAPRRSRRLMRPHRRPSRLLF